MSAAQAGAAAAADGVDLIDEDDGGRVFLGALEEVAHAGSANADEHLHEFGSGDAEEGDVGFAGDGARHQGFAGAGRSDQQDAARHLGADLDVFLRLLEEVDDFFEFQLGGVLPGDIFKLHRWHLGRFLARLRLAEGEDAIHLPLRAASHPDEEADDEHQRQEVDQQRQPGRGLGPAAVNRLHAAFVRHAQELGAGIGRELRGEARDILHAARKR